MLLGLFAAFDSQNSQERGTETAAGDEWNETNGVYLDRGGQR